MVDFPASRGKNQQKTQKWIRCWDRARQVSCPTIWILQNWTTLPHPGEAPENPSKTEVLQSRNAFAGGGFSRGSSKIFTRRRFGSVFWRIKIQQRSLQARQVCWFAGFSSFFLSQLPGVVRFPGNNILGKLSGSFYTVFSSGFFSRTEVEIATWKPAVVLGVRQFISLSHNFQQLHSQEMPATHPVPRKLIFQPQYFRCYFSGRVKLPPTVWHCHTARCVLQCLVTMPRGWVGPPCSERNTGPPCD